MDIPGREHFTKYKELLPDMDLDFMHDFSSAMHLFHKVTILTESYFHKMGLSKGRFLILVNLLVTDPDQGACISDLCPHYQVSSATMTGLLDTLEREGMIERIPNPEDRRKVNVRITDKGRTFMMDFLPRHQANAKDMATHLTRQDRMELPRMLRKLVSGIEEFLENGESGSPSAAGDTEGSPTP